MNAQLLPIIMHVILPLLLFGPVAVLGVLSLIAEFATYKPSDHWANKLLHFWGVVAILTYTIVAVVLMFRYMFPE